MSYSEIDVVEVLEGFPAPAGMSGDSKREVVRRLEERAQRRGDPRPAASELAKLLNVDPRTITRYRRQNREQVAA